MLSHRETFSKLGSDLRKLFSWADVLPEILLFVGFIIVVKTSILWFLEA